MGNAMWVRYGVRYGAFQGYVTVRYGCALRRCVTAVRYGALRHMLRCVTVVHYASALRWCVGDATSWVTVCE